MNLPDGALEMAPEDLAVCILDEVKREAARQHPWAFNFRNYTISLSEGEIALAVAEA